MTAREMQDNYLSIGRDCRLVTGEDLTPCKKRPIMGRRGIGKLASFGIAAQVEVRTVKEGDAVCFRLDYDRMKAWNQARTMSPR
jgi:hypothetical protein